METVSLIAANIEGARQIQGFLTRLFSESKVKNLPIDESLIKSLLGKTGDKEIKKMEINPEKVVDAVSNHFSISKKALTSHGRARIIARPRQILMYLLRTELGLPLQEVGRIIGGRDHSTVLHAVDTISAQDRKSTRLNSSHTVISYAVFCLKKKNTIAEHNE